MAREIDVGGKRTLGVITKVKLFKKNSKNI